jgi:hypothetical protein
MLLDLLNYSIKLESDWFFLYLTSASGSIHPVEEFEPCRGDGGDFLKRRHWCVTPSSARRAGSSPTLTIVFAVLIIPMEFASCAFGPIFLYARILFRRISSSTTRDDWRRLIMIVTFLRRLRLVFSGGYYVLNAGFRFATVVIADAVYSSPWCCGTRDERTQLLSVWD